MNSFRSCASQNAPILIFRSLQKSLAAHVVILHNGFLIWMPLQFLHQILLFQVNYIENRLLLKAFQDSAVQLLLSEIFPSLEQYFWILFISVKWSLPQYKRLLHLKITGVSLVSIHLKHFTSYVMPCTLPQTV